jgi:hypothetical protein
MVIWNLQRWSDFKSICITRKNLNCQFVEYEDRYELGGPDAGAILWTLTMPKTQPPSEEQLDFEAYKTAFNWAIGNRPYPFSTSDFLYARDGVFGVVDADEFDLWLKIWDDGLYLNGGFLYCGPGFVFGTWAEMAIVDKDGIMAPPGTVLQTWVRRSYPPPDGKCDVSTPYAGNPPKGVYIRVRLHRTGQETFPVAVNFNIHKAI